MGVNRRGFLASSVAGGAGALPFGSKSRISRLLGNDLGGGLASRLCRSKLEML